MIQLNLPDIDYAEPGNMSCPGCGAGIAMNLALKALGPDTILVIPACCWAIISGPYPISSLKVPILHTAFASAAVTASGVRAGLDMKGDTKTTVVAWAGDGGTFDIGIQSLSGAAERNDDIIFVCYDNEAYMNTGVQRSSSTPYGTRTTTTPGQGWKRTRKKNIMEILAAHRIPYAATANIAFPEDLVRKFSRARETRGGTRFLHVYASCTTGWGAPSEHSVKISRLATRTNTFPLYEIEDGVRYTLNYEGDRPVGDYLKVQGRFKHLTSSDYEAIQRQVDGDLDLLKRKALLFPAA
jgi:pyruvate ferredoxin oxidoreductase beta subunit/2-oxoisovalerate ferredoxin oxidoreductase beta subunit